MDLNANYRLHWNKRITFGSCVQVEGGFVQGMGWTCLEELVWGDEDHPWLPPGVLHTRGPGALFNSIRCYCQVLYVDAAVCAALPAVSARPLISQVCRAPGVIDTL